MGRAAIYRDGELVAVVEESKTVAWFNRHRAMSMDWYLEHEGYRVESVEVAKLCATCYRLVSSGGAVPTLVRTNNRENPVTVYRHDECRNPMGPYRMREVQAYIRGLVDKAAAWEQSKV